MCGPSQRNDGTEPFPDPARIRDVRRVRLKVATQRSVRIDRMVVKIATSWSPTSSQQCRNGVRLRWTVRRGERRERVHRVAAYRVITLTQPISRALGRAPLATRPRSVRRSLRLSCTAAIVSSVAVTRTMGRWLSASAVCPRLSFVFEMRRSAPKVAPRVSAVNVVSAVSAGGREDPDDRRALRSSWNTAGSAAEELWPASIGMIRNFGF